MIDYKSCMQKKHASENQTGYCDDNKEALCIINSFCALQ